MNRRFWLQEDHATELAQRSLEQSGWTLTADNDWRLAWTLDLPGAGTFAEAATGRWINHLRGIAALTVKSHLCHTLRAGAQRASASGADSLFSFAPQTFVLPGEWDEWMRARAWDPDAVWIQKPADLSRGRGVALVSHPDEVRGGNLVVQRYIANPHLLDGYKYSLRFYVLVVSIDPLVAYVFDDGFTKLASRPYSTDPGDRSDRFRHLTNPDVLRDDPEAEGVSSRNTTHRQYRNRLRQAGIDDTALFARIRRALAATLAAALPGMRAIELSAGGNSRGQFELLGLDIAIDADLQPWLLECNLAPSLSVEASAATDASRDEAALKSQVVADTLRLVGANDGGEPPMLPAKAADARARLAWYDSRRGGFDRLWPSADALHVVACVGRLSDLDRALLADEAAAGAWTGRVAAGVETLTVDDDILLFEARHDRITLLDVDERDSWRALTAQQAPPMPMAAWTHAVEWLGDGLLVAAAGNASRPIAASAAMAPRERIGWNQELVYSRHGLRVALQPATARQSAALDRALAWWSAADESEVDATMYVPPRTAPADVIAHLNRLALQRLGGVVRRPLTFASKDGERVLVIGGLRQARLLFGEGWMLESHHTVIGGEPFGAWTESAGKLEAARLTAIAGSGATRGELLLDLVTAGPGVICAFEPAAVRALAEWIAAIPPKIGVGRK